MRFRPTPRATTSSRGRASSGSIGGGMLVGMPQHRTIPLSILDLAIIGKGQTAADAFANSVLLAQRAEARGYERVWYAEHHNMASIASSATSVLIAHIAAHTSTIRLGAGGVMLPNHSPLTIAEQFGTLATLHPGRIDLGLGRAPGSDQDTMRAMRRDARSSDRFPRGRARAAGLPAAASRASPVSSPCPARARTCRCTSSVRRCSAPSSPRCSGCPTRSPRTSRPRRCIDAVALYRREFRPSAQLAEPYVIAGVNVIAADTDDDAQEQWATVRRCPGRPVRRARPRPHRRRGRRDPRLTQGQQIAQMMHYSAVGTPDRVAGVPRRVRRHADADELIVAHASPTIEQRLRSVELLADVNDPVTV